MSVHYKFKSALEYDTVTFDGLHISVKDLKNAIVQQKRIGKNTDFDLQVTNAQTKEVYDNENTLIPKNTSLLIARIPNAVQNKAKNWEGYGGDSTPPAKSDEGGPIAKAVDLSSLDAPEDDKIKAMMSQSTQDYDPSNYMKIRGANQMGAVPANYRCYKCHQTGHWIKDCPLGQGPDPIDIKKSTGIPRSFMVPVEGPQVQGAMMTPNGSYAVPVLDLQAYTQKTVAQPPVPEIITEIPEDLLCSICSDLLADAVMIPCCGNSFCDECIRSCLLESEDHECPDCHEKDISPGTLIPNRFLRKSVGNFKNDTGYVKKPVYKERVKAVDPPIVTIAEEPAKKDDAPPGVDVDTSKVDAEEKTVISEADSTEQAKKPPSDGGVKDTELSSVEKSTDLNDSIPEGPPGVSPRSSPKENLPVTRPPVAKESEATRPTNGSSKPHTLEQSSRKPVARTRRSPPYGDGDTEDRPGTPTVDEPGMGNYRPPSNSSRTHYHNNGPPGTTIPPMMSMTPTNRPHVPGSMPGTGNAFGTNQPPPNLATFPPTHGPPPNFRLPPPGSAPPYLPPGGYNVPPRPLYDSTRPPMGGPPPNFPPNYNNASRSHHGRDYPNRRDGRARERTPPGVIDDTLAAFNRMLREKDERERRLKQRSSRRSYSRSRSRSRSYSRSPPPRRIRSRSPRRRQSRSRSRSFSISRSRSRSYSGGSVRGSPYRQLSPPARRSPPPLASRKGPSRYRSPVRSPHRHHRSGTDRERPRERDRERDRDRDFDHSRDYGNTREERPYSSRDKEGHRGSRNSGGPDMRDERGDNRYYDNYDDRRGGAASGVPGVGGRPGHHQWGGMPPNRNIGPPPMSNEMGPGGYYPDMHHDYPTNRYQAPPRDYPPPFINKPMDMPPHGMPPVLPSLMSRRFDDIGPPGVEEPPIPGLEPIPRFDPYGQSEPEPPKPVEKERVERKEERRSSRRHDRRSRTPDRSHRNPSPKRKSKSRDLDGGEKSHKKRRRDPSSEREDKEKRRGDHSDEEKSSRKSKDKKKKKEKKEDKDKKKKKDKKERHKKEEKEKDKEKKSKEEAKGGETGKIDKDRFSPELDTKVKAKSPIGSPSGPEEKKEEPPVPSDLYDDILNDGVDSRLVENYGKLEEEKKVSPEKKEPEGKVSELRSNSPESKHSQEKSPELDVKYKNKSPEPESPLIHRRSPSLEKTQQHSDVKSRLDPPLEQEVNNKEFEDEEKDILELHTSDMDLKTEIDKSEVLLPLPEKSKWEVEEELSQLSSPRDSKSEKSEKSGKVTNEVLKRAENAIFAKAINAIRPIEIKKISSDRAKLYAGERDVEKVENKLQITLPVNPEPKKPDTSAPPTRLSVKERLGIKIEEDQQRQSKNKSRSLSPFSKRGDTGRNSSANERQVVEDRKPRPSKSQRDKPTNRDHHRPRERRREDPARRHDSAQKRDERPPNKPKPVEKRRRSPSPANLDKDKHKRKEKKLKKEKPRKHSTTKEETPPKEPKPVEPKPEKRKPNLDEPTFEPDYEESEVEKEAKQAKRKEPPQEKPTTTTTTAPAPPKDNSSTGSSSSSSEEDRKKKKHKKHKKRKKRETSTSSSGSESESSEEERDKRKKKHKKKQKKKKKSKHK